MVISKSSASHYILGRNGVVDPALETIESRLSTSRSLVSSPQIDRSSLLTTIAADACLEVLLKFTRVLLRIYRR